jgi:hypothetical protein
VRRDVKESDPGFEVSFSQQALHPGVGKISGPDYEIIELKHRNLRRYDISSPITKLQIFKSNKLAIRKPFVSNFVFEE